MYEVQKRDGKIAEFDIAKISSAIAKAFDALGKQYHPSTIDLLALNVTAHFEPKIEDGIVSVEDVQDSVEEVLSTAGYADVAKSYILYRKQREKVRNANATLLDYKDLVDQYVKVEDWRVKENSTVTYSVGGLILSNSGAITANYWLSEIYDDEVARAVEVVGLEGLVDELPRGLDTRIGEGARPLSGGQAQRIALARAFLDRSRRILLFDEPTAHLDIETEMELKERMLPLMEGRLVFFATHRLHWVDDMDVVVVMEGGRVTEQGAPEELRAGGGAFARLAAQLEGGAL